MESAARALDQVEHRRGTSLRRCGLDATRIGKVEGVLQKRADALGFARFETSAIPLCRRDSCLRGRRARLPHRCDDPADDGDDQEQRGCDAYLVAPDELAGSIGQRVLARQDRQPVQVSPHVLRELLDGPVSCESRSVRIAGSLQCTDR